MNNSTIYILIVFKTDVIVIPILGKGRKMSECGMYAAHVEKLHDSSVARKFRGPMKAGEISKMASPSGMSSEMIILSSVHERWEGQNTQKVS